MCTVREHRPSISNSARKYAAHLTQEQGEQIWAQAKAQRMENERRERREVLIFLQNILCYILNLDV